MSTIYITKPALVCPVILRDYKLTLSVNSDGDEKAASLGDRRHTPEGQQCDCIAPV